jgi:hypothetical protein
LRTEDGGVDVAAGGLTYADLARKYPDIKTDFDSYALDVVCIETEDLELIEELFSRLNEAVPLSAPEKRNALPGPLPPAVRRLAGHPFFTTNLPYSNRCYRHFDLAAKMLLIESTRDVVDTNVVDTKRSISTNFSAEIETWVKERSEGTLREYRVFLGRCVKFL